MGEIRIGIVLKDGKVLTETEIQEANQYELSMILSHLDLIKDDIKKTFKAGVKQII